MSKVNDRLAFMKKKIEEGKSKFGVQDPRDWSCTLNKEGKGFAIIRFLDRHQFDTDNEKPLPWVERYRHQFKGPNGGYYNELCRSSIGEFSDDPVNVATSPLWKGSEKDKKIAGQRKRKKEFWSNIYVVRDPAKPENEGKVFRFRYGLKIWGKLEAKMNPEFEGEESKDPFDIQEGMNFKLAIRRVEDFPNYDRCAFEAPAPLVEGVEKQKAILAECCDLTELVDPALFKSYEELEKKYNKVVGAPARSSTQQSKDAEDDEEWTSETPRGKTQTQTKSRVEENVEDIDIDTLMKG